jgi:hypothetical protein
MLISLVSFPAASSAEHKTAGDKSFISNNDSYEPITSNPKDELSDNDSARQKNRSKSRETTILNRHSDEENSHTGPGTDTKAGKQADYIGGPKPAENNEHTKAQVKKQYEYNKVAPQPTSIKYEENDQPATRHKQPTAVPKNNPTTATTVISHAYEANRTPERVSTTEPIKRPAAPVSGGVATNTEPASATHAPDPMPVLNSQGNGNDSNQPPTRTFSVADANDNAEPGSWLAPTQKEINMAVSAVIAGAILVGIERAMARRDDQKARKS